jgi:hypothetical protein
MMKNTTRNTRSRNGIGNNMMLFGITDDEIEIIISALHTTDPDKSLNAVKTLENILFTRQITKDTIMEVINHD